MSQNKTAEWQLFASAPKEGTALIVWVSSQQGVSGHHRQRLFFKGTMEVGRDRGSLTTS
ncbi:MAG: hypothetical protein ABI604_16730 [Nitrospirota bacterium]